MEVNYKVFYRGFIGLAFLWLCSCSVATYKPTSYKKPKQKFETVCLVVNGEVFKSGEKSLGGYTSLDPTSLRIFREFADSELFKDVYLAGRGNAVVLDVKYKTTPSDTLGMQVIKGIIGGGSLMMIPVTLPAEHTLTVDVLRNSNKVRRFSYKVEGTSWLSWATISKLEEENESAIKALLSQFFKEFQTSGIIRKASNKKRRHYSADQLY